MYRSSAALVRYLAAQVRHPARPPAHPRPRQRAGPPPPRPPPPCTGTRARTGTGPLHDPAGPTRRAHRAARARAGDASDPQFKQNLPAGHPGLRERRRPARAALQRGPAVHRTRRATTPRCSKDPGLHPDGPAGRRPTSPTGRRGGKISATQHAVAADRDAAGPRSGSSVTKAWFQNPASTRTTTPTAGSHVRATQGRPDRCAGLRNRLPEAAAVPRGTSRRPA